MRLNGEDAGTAFGDLGGVAGLGGGDGADLAELLGDDEVGAFTFEEARIEVVDAAAGMVGGADRGIDFSAAQTGGEGDAADEGLAADFGWVVAVVGDTDDGVAPAEGVEDLRGAGEQGDDLQGRSILRRRSICGPKKW